MRRRPTSTDKRKNLSLCVLQNKKLSPSTTLSESRKQSKLAARRKKNERKQKSRKKQRRRKRNARHLQAKSGARNHLANDTISVAMSNASPDLCLNHRIRKRVNQQKQRQQWQLLRTSRSTISR